MNVARQQKSRRQGILPKAESRAGKREIKSVEEILTAKQRKALYEDLSEMARRRHEAEASSASLRLS